MNSKEFLSLPVYKYQVDIGCKIKNHSRLIVIGETGCGKTTQIPKIILNSLGRIDPNEPKVRICITQPRRVAAISVANRVSQELGLKIGTTVGYSVRFDERSSGSTQIKYMTDGMLLREAILDNSLSGYDVVIIDEIHERSINTDTLLALILRIQSYRKDLKLVVMSATIKVNPLMEYLQTENVVTIEGRSHPIEVYHSIDEQSNFIDAACTAILQIHLMDMDKPGDILVFLPGQEDIEDLNSLLESKNSLLLLDKQKYPKLLSVFQLFSNLPNSEQLKVFQQIDSSRYRKVILSTNIAETSLTIRNIKYVIDSGFYKTKVYDYGKDLDTLVLDKINKNSAIQRTGRAGRESSGKCFRLYTEDEYNKMIDNPKPEILRTSLVSLILLLKSIGIEDVHSLRFYDKPEKQTIQKALEELKVLRALDIREELTELGKKLSTLPLDPSQGICLINAFFNDEYRLVQDDILTIIALLQTDNIFFSSQTQREKAEQARSKFINVSSDHLTLLNVYKQWREVKADKIIKSDKWAQENFINERSLAKAEDIKRQLQRYIVSMQVNGEDKVLEDKLDSFLIEKSKVLLEDKAKLQETKEYLILKCLCSGFQLKIAKYDSDNVFCTIKGKNKCRLHPTSVLSKNIKLAKESGLIIYSEIVFTSKQYLKLCSVITKEMTDRFNIK